MKASRIGLAVISVTSKKPAHATGDDQRRERARLERERDKLTKKRKRLMGAIASGTVSQAEAADVLTPIRDRIE